MKNQLICSCKANPHNKPVNKSDTLFSLCCRSSKFPQLEINYQNAQIRMQNEKYNTITFSFFSVRSLIIFNVPSTCCDNKPIF